MNNINKLKLLTILYYILSITTTYLWLILAIPTIIFTIIVIYITILFYRLKNFRLED